VWLAAAPDEADGATNKMEVRLAEAGYAVGQPGVKLRLTLMNGQAVEYVAEDSREADAALRLTEMFVAGRVRMYAELDGRNAVRALQIAGPAARVAQ
jgi:hypothetical protein